MMATTGAAIAQTVPDAGVPQTGLDIPENLQIFGKLDPNVRKPTAIVNGVVITGTDVDQRMALIIAANQYQLGDQEREQLRLMVLRGLIDEVLQIQEAKTNDITITSADIDQAYGRVAANFKQSPQGFGAYLRSIGSSERSVRKQIEGELAWQRYLRRNVEPHINVSDEEVQSILDRMNRDKGTPEYHLFEIYKNATPDRAPAVVASMQEMMQGMKDGKQPFAYYAQTFSDATTSSAQGDLGWVRASMLPTELSNAAAEMQVGQLAGPIETPGGFSILYLADKRTVLGADPRSAKLSLKQIKITFPAGTSQEQAQTRATEFAKATQAITGCGAANQAAAAIGAEVVDNDSLTVRDLPGPLQEMILKMQIGQATPPFGSPAEGVSVLVLCGRDDPKAGSLPNPQELQNAMEQDRVNKRAQTILRDLRRDAIVEYR
ncbi:MAG: peptidylprolyl isomerase [Sphingomonas sp.]|uniref:peptidylprolyl isomerase n=1 Tax=Sphingomonas sp. TaxID=28214 RepID=UPI003F8226BE